MIKPKPQNSVQKEREFGGLGVGVGQNAIVKGYVTI